MKRKYTTLLATVTVAVGAALFGATQAEAVPVMAPQIVGYSNWGHNPADEIYRSTITNDCSTEQRFYPSAYVALRLSGNLLWVPSGHTYCNYMWVQTITGDRWGDCINKYHYGYDFGPGYNDGTWVMGVTHSSACPNYDATQV
jgi:hypothetical protein